jgi:hypothetical protein
MLMRYTVHCALKWGDTVTVSDATGADLILYGNLGLAPDWVRGALDTPSQGWLTACLLAHSNNFGERVDILLTGEHPALQAPIMRGDMPLQEAAFYGNLFPLPGGAKPFLFACTGWDAQSCDATIISADLKRRVCGRSTQCGFDAVGPCWTAGTTTPDACDRAPGDLEDFTACHPYPGSPPTGDAYAQVITVDLKAVDMRSAHPTCTSKLPPPADGCSHGLCDQGAVLSPTCDACTAAICAVDPYCCNVAWDGWCVGEVSSTCNCLEGLPRTCDTCAADVAALPGQAYCARAWDALCIRDLPTVGCAACP